MAGCSKQDDGKLQGWIEGDFIFVSPDEQGRIEHLLVREGDAVKKDQLIVVLDSDLQQSDLGVAQATLTNTKQAFDRAQQLAKSGAGTQKDFDVAQALYREAQARLDAAQTRLTRRKLFSPVEGMVQQVYYRPGETVPVGRSIVSIAAARQCESAFLRCRAVAGPKVAIDDPIRFCCDGCPPDMDGKMMLHLALCRIYTAGDLFDGGAAQACLSHRSQAATIRRHCVSASRSMSRCTPKGCFKIKAAPR